MKKFLAVLVSLVLVIAAALLVFIYFQGRQSIVVDEPQTASSAPAVVSSEQPNIEVPVPQGNVPVQEDAIVPTVEPPVASEPVVDKPSGNDTSSTASTPSKPKDSPPAGGNTPGGGSKDGKVYLPGFGWVDVCSGVQADVGEHSGTGDIIGY